MGSGPSGGAGQGAPPFTGPGGGRGGLAGGVSAAASGSIAAGSLAQVLSRWRTTCVGVGGDELLGERRRLGEQQEGPVLEGGVGGHALELLDGGDDVEHA